MFLIKKNIYVIQMNNIFDFDDIILFIIFIYKNSDTLLNEYGGF
jgi:hypothetical protein